MVQDVHKRINNSEGENDRLCGRPYGNAYAFMLGKKTNTKKNPHARQPCIARGVS